MQPDTVSRKEQPWQHSAPCRTKPTARITLVLLSATLAAMGSLVSPSVLQAAHQFRCNGKVQYRPCSTPVANGKLAAKREPKRTLTGALTQLGNTWRARPRSDFSSGDVLANANDVRGPIYAKVMQQSYARLSAREGQWRGVVRGNGDIHLTLQILRSGDVVASRYMGHVQLVEKSTSFNYKSVPPPGGDWGWRILASARPPLRR